jgi:HK97 family phage major capsid protein
MKLTKTEFDHQLDIVRTLRGEARATLLKTLRDAKVVEVNKEDGNEIEIDIEIVEKDFLEDDDRRRQAIANNRKVHKVGLGDGFRPMDGGIASPIAKSMGRVNHFKGADAVQRAERWGAFMLASRGNERMKQWLGGQGIHVKSGNNEGNNAEGGILVPDQLVADLIDLRNEYGVARRNSYVLGMTSDHAKRPRRAGGLSAYFVGEGKAGTASTKVWNSVGLTAKKLMVLSKMTSELNEDAIIQLGDDLAGEIAYAFAVKEDDCAFNGDGTSTYGGIDGIAPKLKSINGVDEGAGLVLASGNLWSEIVLADFHRVLARTPSYAKRGGRWYMSPTFIDEVAMKLVYAAGGASGAELTSGVTNRSFLGYPIEPVETMPGTQANSQVAALFGDLRQACTFGDRRVVTIDFATTGTVDGEDLFSTDQIAIRGTERIDFVAHDLGDSSTPGAVVGLITQAS